MARLSINGTVRKVEVEPDTPTDEQIASEMSNICRCGTYNRIKAAIKLASSTMAG
jgi:aerobic-type carbon monoxide dehydrogenase small subunit (CoxS/CutS family)